MKGGRGAGNMRSLGEKGGKQGLISSKGGGGEGAQSGGRGRGGVPQLLFLFCSSIVRLMSTGSGGTPLKLLEESAPQPAQREKKDGGWEKKKESETRGCL